MDKVKHNKMLGDVLRSIEQHQRVPGPAGHLMSSAVETLYASIYRAYSMPESPFYDLLCKQVCDVVQLLITLSHYSAYRLDDEFLAILQNAVEVTESYLKAEES